MALALITTALYLVFILNSIDEYEKSMMATLVGHEVEEIVVDLHQNPNAVLPVTATVEAYLQSRDEQQPVPEFLRELEPNHYKRIAVDEKSYYVVIFDLADDRFYLAFNTTYIEANRKELVVLLVSGVIAAMVVLVISGIWLFSKFLRPVSQLAREVSNIDVNDRGLRFGSRYRQFEVGQISLAIDSFMERLDEFIEREQTFTDAASHELRTPVAVVASATDLLEQKGLEPGQKKIVGRIREATSYMGNVIESLLFMARNSYDQLEKTMPNICLSSVTQNIAKKHDRLARDKGLKLEFRELDAPKARMKETHLEMILANLIRNAVNHTDEGKIEVKVYENRISVSDTGRGIDASVISLIVKRNYHSPDSKGYGLGLYLVSKICLIYGIELKVESEPGKGSEFSLEFPANMLTVIPKAS